MSEDIARILLENKVVELNAAKPFTYNSGIRSPIYNDNRLLAGYVSARKRIISRFVEVLDKLDYEVIAGTSTAGIMWAAWVSDRLDKPMCYIRGEAKEHGKKNQIEGAPVNGKKVVIIEDLISTGGSSFAAVKAARDNGGTVTDVVAIFTYEMEKAKKLFYEGNCRVHTLTEFSTLVKVAKDINYVTGADLNKVLEWNKEPAAWGPKYGFSNAERK